MAAPAVSVSADSPEESFGDTTEIDIAEAERATLRATIRTMGVVEMSLCNRMKVERQNRIEIEHQLALVMAAPPVSVSADSPRSVFGRRSKPEHLLEVPILEELRAIRDRSDVAEAERATLRATVRTMGAVKTSLHNRMRDERQNRIEIE
ncbi:hypothetical protein Tco_0883122, partial [Tanacetum coccineum]